MTEREILEKLITKEHINLIEKEHLPEKMAWVRILVEIIVEQLESNRKFPKDRDLKEDFSGAFILQLSDQVYGVYKKDEVSLMRYEIVQEETYTEAKAAANAYLKLAYKDDIDGVRLKWS